MIITLTLNPAVDQTIFVDHLEVGQVNRFNESQLDPAGKGINVSRVAHRLGWPTIAFGFLAGEIGAIARKALDDEAVQHHFVPVPGQTRINVTVVDEQNRVSTSFYGQGPAVDRDHLSRLDELLRFWLESGRVLVLAGSMPPGVSEDAYASYIRLAGSHGIKTILDADGEPFRLGVAAKPYLIKPNVAEAERLLGRSLPNTLAVVNGARELASQGITVVVVSMGGEGAICVEGNKVWRALPPEVERRSTVGSGDSLVAGLAVALARGNDIVEGLRLGTAAGAATAMTQGTALGTSQEITSLLPQVRIEEIT
ncbi:MAG: 1-phosphofructokinase [Chloroflexi bacterium]|nr:1-phosphofructokinase [Chloroflexota bacterium]MDA8188769.1 1-phosphofructokinase [Dehalococcoidales bacterium]